MVVPALQVSHEGCGVALGFIPSLQPSPGVICNGWDEGMGGLRLCCLGLSLPSPPLASRLLYLQAVAEGQVTSSRDSSSSFCRCFIIALLASADPSEARLQLGSLSAPSKVL